jgi:CBS domain-containing protein/sporulation protein YlmC with PRC-barrel domain
MISNGNAVKNGVEETYFLSTVLGTKVLWNGKKIGTLADMVIMDGNIAEVTRLYITRPFGYPSLLVPWEKVKSLGSKEVVIDIEDIEKYQAEPTENMVLLRDHILDKKVLDLDGSEVDVVYDIKLVNRNQKLYATDVDFSRYGLIRRVHLKFLADFINKLAERFKDQTLSWTYIQPLPKQISSFKGDVRLKVLKEKLADIRPEDMADIIEDLDHDQRVAIFDELEPEHASDTLEEITPNIQRDLVPSLRKEKVARLINEMTTGQAADVLAVLPSSEARAILALLDQDKAQKIQSILTRQEQKIIDFATQSFIKLPPGKTVGEAQREYRKIAKGKDAVMYIHVVDDNDKLLGIIDIKELLQGESEALVKDIMEDKVIVLDPESTLEEASALFDRYEFRSIPVVDNFQRLLGVILFRDIMNLKHRFMD